MDVIITASDFIELLVRNQKIELMDIPQSLRVSLGATVYNCALRSASELGDKARYQEIMEIMECDLYYLEKLREERLNKEYPYFKMTCTHELALWCSYDSIKNAYEEHKIKAESFIKHHKEQKYLIHFK